MEDIGGDPRKHVLELFRIKGVGLEEGDSGDTEGKHCHLAVLQNGVRVDPVDDSHRIHIFDFSKSAGQTLLRLPVIAKVVCKDVIASIIQHFVKLHIINGIDRHPAMAMVGDATTLVGTGPALMSHNGQFVGALVLGRDVPSSKVTSVHGLESDLFKVHAIGQGGSHHFVGDTPNPSSIHDDMGSKFVDPQGVTQLLQERGFVIVSLVRKAGLEDLLKTARRSHGKARAMERWSLSLLGPA